MKLKGIIKDCDKVLLFFSVVLCLFGLFNIVTVSSQEATAISADKSIYYYFYRQLFFVGLGFVATLIILARPMSEHNKLAKYAFYFIVLLNIIAICQGSITRGARNWIKYKQFGVQPSELAKPVIIVCLAYLFEKYAKKLKNPKIDNTEIYYKILVLGIAVPALVFFQKDIGTFTILFVTFLVMFCFAPLPKKNKIKLFKYMAVLGLVVSLGLFIINGNILTGAQKSRLDYIRPCDPEKFQGGGYQVCNAFIAINRGNLTGVGIGKSTQKYSYIPEPHTDMVFAIISEEYGFIVGALIIISYLIIIYRILDLSQYATSISGRFTCLGIAVYIFLHIFINLGGMFGLIPLTGVPLPFLSYGGSFLFSLIVSLAIVQRIYIDTKRCKENLL